MATRSGPIGAGAERGDRLARARFDVVSTAPRVSLSLNDARGAALLVSPMVRDAPARWSLSLWLKPGAYRYRYYAHHGPVSIYLPPDEVELRSVTMAGLDGLVTVEPPPDARSCVNAARDRADGELGN